MIINFTKRTRRPLVPFCDVPKKFQGCFDYTEENEKGDDRFFSYKGFWYDITQFMGTSNDDRLKNWDGIFVESVSSGAVASFVQDADSAEVWAAFFWVTSG